MAHRLELVLRDAVETRPKIRQLETAFTYLDKIHHKGGGTFDSYQRFAVNMGVRNVKRVRAISGTRWAAKVMSALKTVIADFSPLHAWFVAEKQPPQLQFIFLEGAFWLYACYELFTSVSQLSLYVQRERSTAFSISSRLEELLDNLREMAAPEFMPKRFHFSGRQAVIENFDGVSDTLIVDPQILQTNQAEFSEYVKNVIAAFAKRFPEDQRNLLRSFTVFDLQTWPVPLLFQPLDNFGSNAIAEIAKYVEAKSLVTEARSEITPFVQQAVEDWELFKTTMVTKVQNFEFIKKMEPLTFWESVLGGNENLVGDVTCPIVGNALAKIIECVLVLPLGSTENERIGAAMKRIVKKSTTIKARTLNSLLFLQLNGPVFEKFDAFKYGHSWTTRPRKITAPQDVNDLIIEQNLEGENLYEEANITN